MKHLKPLVIASILGLIIISNSCVKDNFDFDKLTNEIHYTPSLAAPLVYGNISLLDGLEAFDSLGYVKVNGDGFLSLMFFDYAESDTVSELMDIGNQSFTQTIQASGIDFTGFNTPGQEMTVDYNYTLHFDFFNPDAEIDSIWFDLGSLGLSAISTFDHAITLNFTLPTVKKDGAPFSKSISLQPYGDEFPDIGEDGESELIGYHADMTQTALGYNEIPININLVIRHAGGNNTGQLNVGFNVNNPDHEAMFGYFGHTTLIFESGKINMELFDLGDNWALEDFWFEDPKFKAYYTNSYGIPTNFYFDSVVAHSTYYDQDYDILSYGGGLPVDSLDPFDMSYPTEFGASIEDSIILDRTNSNIREVIQQRPAWIKFIAHAFTNPGGSSGHHNFVWDNSKFRADVEIELPIWGYIDRFHGIDTIDLDIAEEFDDPEVIKRLLIRLNIDNGLPIFVEAQAYFLDENYAIIDSVIQVDDIRLIESAEIDNDGKVISKTFKTIDLEMTGIRLENIMNTKYLLFKTSASTTNAINDEKIKIYPEYEVGFDVAMEADLDIEVDLDTLDNDNENE
jgi:hypothetical protein